MFQKIKPHVNQRLRNFAEGRPCQMQSRFCNGNQETVVLCHSRRRAGAGMAQKPHDFWGYHGCSECHRNEDKLDDGEILDAIRRTQYAIYAKFRSLTP